MKNRSTIRLLRGVRLFHPAERVEFVVGVLPRHPSELTDVAERRLWRDLSGVDRCLNKRGIFLVGKRHFIQHVQRQGDAVLNTPPG